MQEREVVTTAFGNYSTLVAAQWANGTSNYDVHHNTLYYERRADRVQGGISTGGIVRVPRLLLLDAPHATTIREINEVEQEAEAQAQHHESNEEGQYDTDASALLINGVTYTGEEERIERAAAYTRRKWWERGIESDEDEDESGYGNDKEHEEDDERDGWEQYYSSSVGNVGVQSPRYSDPTSSGAAAGLENITEEEREKLSKQDLRAIKKKLFRMRDSTVPWWRYITTGLDVESITSLRPLCNVDASGDVPASHSFGYGLINYSADHETHEVATMCDALRRQLESADLLQGLQCFVDSDSLFGGIAHNVLEKFADEQGLRVPCVIFSIFTALPAVLQDEEASQQIAFAGRRRDESWLNRLLATSALSQRTSSLYVPIEAAQWAQFFGASRQERQGSGAASAEEEAAEGSGAWLGDDRATAQYIAAIADTALYGVRDGGNPEAMDPQEAAVGASKGPAYYMQELCRTVRPTPSLRVASLLGALPLRVHDANRRRNDLWGFLEDTPMLPMSAEGHASPATGAFVPLSHPVKHTPNSDAGAVLGHSVSFRGAGVLPSQVYPTREAMMRYALPLRTATYLPLLTQSNYPVSRTFPMSTMFRNGELTEAQAEAMRGVMEGVDVGAHLLSTNDAAGMIGNIVVQGKKALHHKMDMYCKAYGMEKDDWSDRLEDVQEIYDCYHRQGSEDDDEDDDQYY